MPQTSLTPPRWPLAALRAALPSDAVGDAIVGDLHEEFVHEAASLGASRARARYWGRAAGVILHATFDALRWRSWASGVSTVEVPATPTASAASAHLGAGVGIGVGVLAFGVLAVGIVANTVLFAAIHGEPGLATRAGSAVSSAIGVGATALALLCAGAAAVVLCAGPRWLRRRLARGVPPRES
jgi:hypothetical protein